MEGEINIGTILRTKLHRPPPRPETMYIGRALLSYARIYEKF
jgi:hypothetical protein